MTNFRVKTPFLLILGRVSRNPIKFVVFSGDFFPHPNSKGKKGGTDKIRVLWQKLMHKHSKFYFFLHFREI